MNAVVVTLALSLVASIGCGGPDEPDSAQDAIDAWVAAINERDWSRVCELEGDAGERCAARLERAYDRDAGRVRSAGRYQEGDRLIYGVDFPAGPAGLSARRVDGEWRVHPEIQVVR